MEKKYDSWKTMNDRKILETPIKVKVDFTDIFVPQGLGKKEGENSSGLRRKNVVHVLVHIAITQPRVETHEPKYINVLRCFRSLFRITLSSFRSLCAIFPQEGCEQQLT